MARTALIIIDMQVASFTPPSSRHDAAGLIERLNRLAARTRTSGGLVVFVQHDGPNGDPHHPDSDGWRLLPELDRRSDDIIVRKKSCDSFLATDLDSVLREAEIDHLVITGCATDYCVDTTVRSALGRGWTTTVPSDGHTTGTNRPHLSAEQIIAHHNAVWADFISPAGAARVCPCAEALRAIP
jgi:nicotinamidase-related amidase